MGNVNEAKHKTRMFYQNTAQFGSHYLTQQDIFIATEHVAFTSNHRELQDKWSMHLLQNPLQVHPDFFLLALGSFSCWWWYCWLCWITFSCLCYTSLSEIFGDKSAICYICFLKSYLPFIDVQTCSNSRFFPVSHRFLWSLMYLLSHGL